MVCKLIFILYNIIINFFFIRYNMDTKSEVSHKDDDDIEKNNKYCNYCGRLVGDNIYYLMDKICCSNNCSVQFIKKINYLEKNNKYCNYCSRFINKDIYCLLDKIYCSNNCRIQFIKKNNIRI
jgi:hypothetical protein